MTTINVPSDIPCAKHGCSLPAMAVSDKATILALFLGAIFWIFLQVHNTNPVSFADFIKRSEAVLGVILLATAGLQYYVGAWYIERAIYHELVALRTPYRKIEAGIRFLVFFIITAGVAFFGRDSLFAVLAFYAFIVLWDVVVAVGGGYQLAKAFILWDIGGLLSSGYLILAILYTANPMGKVAKCTDWVVHTFSTSSDVYSPVLIVLVAASLIAVLGGQITVRWYQLSSKAKECRATFWT